MNVSKPIMLSLVFAFFMASCASIRDYRSNNTRPKSPTYTSITKKEADLRQDIVNYALKQIGARYKYGGRGPNNFDCSGLTHFAFKKYNIAVSGSSQSQSNQGRKISIQKAKKGDLIFFGKNGKINHVGLVVANTSSGLEVVHSTSSKGVIRQDVMASSYWKPRIMVVRDVITK